MHRPVLPQVGSRLPDAGVERSALAIAKRLVATEGRLWGLEQFYRYCIGERTAVGGSLHPELAALVDGVTGRSGAVLPQVGVSQAGEVKVQRLPGAEAGIGAEGELRQWVESDDSLAGSLAAIGSDGHSVGSRLADEQGGLHRPVLPQVGRRLPDVSVEGGGLAFAEGLAATEVDWRGLYYFN